MQPRQHGRREAEQQRAPRPRRRRRGCAGGAVAEPHVADGHRGRHHHRERGRDLGIHGAAVCQVGHRQRRHRPREGGGRHRARHAPHPAPRQRRRGGRDEDHQQHNRRVAAQRERRRGQQRQADRMDRIGSAIPARRNRVRRQFCVVVRGVVLPRMVVLDAQVVVREQALRDDEVVRLVAPREHPRRGERHGRRAKEHGAGREDDEVALQGRPRAHPHHEAAPAAGAEHRPGDLACDDQPDQQPPRAREDPQDRHPVGQPGKVRQDEHRQRVERQERIPGSGPPGCGTPGAGNGARRVGETQAQHRADGQRKGEAGRQLGQVRQHRHPDRLRAVHGDVERAQRHPERRAGSDPRAHSPEVHSISSMMVYNSTLPAGPGRYRAGRR